MVGKRRFALAGLPLLFALSRCAASAPAVVASPTSDGGAAQTSDAAGGGPPSTMADAAALDAPAPTEDATVPAGPFTIGGSLSGLFGGGPVVLQDNLGDNLTLTQDGPFSFATPLARGKAYSITVLSAPAPAVTCTASANTGTVGGANVADVAVKCVLYPSCGALHRAAVALPSGFYPLSIGGTGYNAYCDMATDGGGWTEVYDQDVTVGAGYLPLAAWAAGVNMQFPNSGQYSILPVLGALKGTNPSFEFRLEWPNAPAPGSVQWTQTENPLASGALPTVTSVTEDPAAQTDNCGNLGFRGLSLTGASNAGNGQALLNGDAATGCFYWAVATSSAWNGGIPAYNTAASRARLWVRTADADITDAGSADADAAPFSPCPTGAPCAVMPLGDSITFGYQSSTGGGYRTELLEDIWDAGHTATFVGSSSSGPTTLGGKPFPQANEGHSGYTIDDAPALMRSGIAPLVPGSLAMYAPSIVLLMIGTNDVDTNNDLANAPFRLGTLIDTITSLRPNALLVVAQITPTGNATENANVEAYNAAIPGLVQSRVALGRHVLLVDMYSTFMADPSYATDDMADNLHPNDKGYALMGDAWYAVIEPYLR